MPGWAWWVVGAAGWVLAAALTGLLIGATVRLRDWQVTTKNGEET